MTFRVLDIVGVPDKRHGIVRDIEHKTNSAYIQFGADGPYEWHDLDTLRFVRDEHLARSGGRDFFARSKPRGRLPYGKDRH